MKPDNLNCRFGAEGGASHDAAERLRRSPVSALLMNERPPDLVFQKSLNTFAKRHHVRIWKLAKKYNGREVWVGAATHDIATTQQSSRNEVVASHRSAY